MGRWVVDGMNVIGAVPDGWWKDRGEAVRRLVEKLGRYAEASGDVVTVVLDGAPFQVPDAAIQVLFAPGGPDAADDMIVRLVAEAESPGDIAVATSDRALEGEVRALGASVESAGSFRRKLSTL